MIIAMRIVRMAQRPNTACTPMISAKIPNKNAVPSVPTPAPAAISPVAFSSTAISKTFKSGEDPSVIFLSTFAKIPLAFSLLMDLFTSKTLYGSKQCR